MLLLFPVLNWLLLLAVTLSVLLLLPPRRAATAGLGAAGLAVALAGAAPTSVAESATLAWVLAAVASFVLVTLARPAWAFFPRGLSALACAVAAVGAWLAATGSWSRLDAQVRLNKDELTRNVIELMSGIKLVSPAGIEAYGQWLKARGDAELAVFPAFAALQTLIALALAWWLFVRFAPHGGRWAQLGPLREFRFSDHLVWIAIAGLVLLLLPPGAGTQRAGANALVFMGGLYAVRGLGVFLHATRASPLRTALVIGVLALLQLWQFVFVPALMVGLGDTWLDLRRRGTLVPRA
jgi:hypothetical protein